MVAQRLAILEAKKTPEQKEKEAKRLKENKDLEENNMERKRDDEERRRSNREMDRNRTKRMDMTEGTVTEMEEDQVTSKKGN